MNPYDVLGVAPDSSLETLKAAYRRLARDNHPDSALGDDERAGATQRMSAINAAWQLLGDPVQRAAFDARLRAEQQARELKAQAIRNAAPARKSLATPPKTARRTPFVTPSTRVARSVNQSRHPKAPSKAAPSGRSKLQPARRGAKSAARPVKLSTREKLGEAMRLFHEHGSNEAAIALCLSVLRTDFRSVAARELLSDIYVAQGQVHRAFALLEQALLLQPTNAALVRKLNQLSNRSGTLNSASTQQRSSTAFEVGASPTPSAELSPLATSVKYSVLGQLFARLLGKTVGKK